MSKEINKIKASSAGQFCIRSPTAHIRSLNKAFLYWIHYSEHVITTYTVQVVPFSQGNIATIYKLLVPEKTVIPGNNGTRHDIETY